MSYARFSLKMRTETRLGPSWLLDFNRNWNGSTDLLQNSAKIRSGFLEELYAVRWSHINE